MGLMSGPSGWLESARQPDYWSFRCALVEGQQVHLPHCCEELGLRQLRVIAMTIDEATIVWDIDDVWRWSGGTKVAAGRIGRISLGEAASTSDREVKRGEGRGLDIGLAEVVGQLAHQN
jgi:hypothetical protein